MILTKNYQLVSNTRIGNFGGIEAYIRLYAKYSQQDLTNNRSYVFYKSVIYASGDYIGTYSGTTKWISGNGVTKIEDSANGTYYAGETLLYEVGGWIYHNSEGKAKAYASAYWGSSAWGMGTSTNFNISLPDILRGSLLTSFLNYETDLAIIPIETSTQLEVIFTKYVTTYYDKLVIKIGNTIVKTITGATSPTIFNFTVNEINNIYSLMPLNTADLVIDLITYSDSTMTTQIGTTNTKTALASIINANPIFSNFEYQDVNENTLALTSDNSKIINGKSNLKVIISNANMAIGQKGATIEYYKINDVIYENYTINNNVKTYNTSFEKIINGYSLNNITIYAIDNRNNSTQLIKLITNFINYSPVVVSSKNVERLGSINEETKFDFSGMFWNDNFGQSFNEILANYRYKETSTESWITGTSPISILKSGNNFSFSGYLKGNTELGFGADKSYNVEIILNDKIDNEIITYLVENGIPGLDVFKNFLGIHGIYDEAVGGVLQISGVKIAELVDD